MKILCIKDHVHSSINDSRGRIRAITNPNFVVGCLNKRTKMMKMSNRHFYNFLRITVAVYFTYFESIEALTEHVVWQHPSSEPLLLYGTNGRVCTIPSY